MPKAAESHLSAPNRSGTEPPAPPVPGQPHNQPAARQPAAELLLPERISDFVTRQLTRGDTTRSLGQELPKRLTPSRGCSAAMQPHGSTPPRTGGASRRGPRPPVLFSLLAHPSHAARSARLFFRLPALAGSLLSAPPPAPKIHLETHAHGSSAASKHPEHRRKRKRRRN